MWTPCGQTESNINEKEIRGRESILFSMIVLFTNCVENTEFCDNINYYNIVTIVP